MQRQQECRDHSLNSTDHGREDTLPAFSAIQQRLPNVFNNGWKIGSLPSLLAGDFLAAAISATMVSPLVASIDRAVVENASAAQRPLLASLRTHVGDSFLQPRRFFSAKPFFVMWTLYAVTYSTANASESIGRRFMDKMDQAALSTTTFLATFLVNVPLGVWKDVKFAQYYGTAPNPVATPVTKTPAATKPQIRPQGFPMAAGATFLLRDAVTIFGSFALAPILSASVPDSLAADPNAKATVSQLVVPVLTQLVATPAHLLGLDLYSRPHNVETKDRIQRVRRNLGAATAMRCFRIVPAFGFGCVMNTHLRSFFHEQCTPLRPRKV